MRYPWVAISLIIVWFGSTYIILKTNVNVTYFLLTTIVGTIAIALIGFYETKEKK